VSDINEGQMAKQQGDITSPSKRGQRRTLIGVVTSNKMQKTVVVQVTRRVKTPKFEKYITRRVKYKAHSEGSNYLIGDKVMIIESRPLSKDKHWRVQKLVERARTA
jgi:small subunit ribosomal protein S17